MRSIRDALQGVQVDLPMIQPIAARLPFIRNPPPALAQLPTYPGLDMKTPSEILGGQIMPQYSM